MTPVRVRWRRRLTVIGDHKSHVAVDQICAHLDRVACGVAGDVGQRFSGDAVHGSAGRSGEIGDSW